MDDRRDRAMRGEKIRQHAHESPGLYVHVPFCKTKCPYCDFYSVTNLTLIEEWIHALSQEMKLYRDKFAIFDTLYIGGGTPTVLEDTQLISLFEKVFDHFTFSDNTEITVEANPDDITPEKLSLLKSLGVNRISIGVQSFKNEELKFLQRRHSREGTKEALRCVKEAGFSNFSIDLIYGLPGQTNEGWISTLEEALTFHPTHMSCYQLTIEQRTPFGKMLKKGNLDCCDEETEKDFFLCTSQALEENGFVHYEISNFARSDEFRSRHNCKYWQHIPYLGLGPGAHSFLNGQRWWNHRSVKMYCDDLQKGLHPTEGSEALSPDQLRLERLFLGLRTSDGVSLEDAFPGFQINGSLESMVKNHLITICGERLTPTRQGFLMADQLPLLFP
jgi:oxygen-independent coproporphyrinogen-3 oxidase